MAFADIVLFIKMYYFEYVRTTLNTLDVTMPHSPAAVLEK